MKRRDLLLSGLALAGAPGWARAQQPTQLDWSDLIPEGQEPARIIGKGEKDEELDIWKPQYEESARLISEDLDGQMISLPGFMVPLDFSPEGTRSFLFAPYAGACVHVPPPPANQIIYASSEDYMPFKGMEVAVIATGVLHVSLMSTSLADVGYQMSVTEIAPHRG